MEANLAGKLIRSETAAPGGRPRLGFRASRESTRFSELLICQVDDEEVHALHMTRNGQTSKATELTLSIATKSEQVVSRLGRAAITVLVLPKSMYLIRHVDLPAVESGELPMMLRLEMESLLPPEYGSIALAYRQVSTQEGSSQRFETYVLREEDLSKQLSTLVGVGLTPGFVIPSALCWVEALGRQSTSKHLVAVQGPDHLEAASLTLDGGLAIRTIDTTEELSGSYGLSRGLVDYLRSTLGSKGETGGGGHSVDWIGGNFPGPWRDSCVALNDVSLEFFTSATCGAVETSSHSRYPLLHLAARALCDRGEPNLLDSVNLLPRSMLEGRLRKALAKQLVILSIAMLLALTVAYLALEVLVHRHQIYTTDLSQKIAVIRAAGETVERRIDDLNAVAVARKTHDDFHNVLLGLYRATPDDVTYNHVELSDGGKLVLRGQADSLALPFLLPQKLESQEMFSQVVLRDAGQTKKTGGSITEFLIDCKLERLKAR